MDICPQSWLGQGTLLLLLLLKKDHMQAWKKQHWHRVDGTGTMGLEGIFKNGSARVGIRKGY